MKSLVFILFAALSQALSSDPTIYIYAPDEVTADTPFEARIDVEEHNGDTTFCDTFRVLLATRPGREDDNFQDNAFFYHTDCYVVHEQSLCDPTIEIGDDYVFYKNTTFTFSIPASVGPSGRHYALKALTLNTDGSHYAGSLESNVFNLIGGTGEWGSRADGSTLWGDEGIPCSSYQCVQGCVERTDNGTFYDTYSSYEDCTNSCPDVYIDPSSSYGGYPTAALTTPTQCSVFESAATSTFEPTGTGDDFLSPTRSRIVAAAAGTGSASSVMRIDLSGICLITVGLVFAMFS